MSEEQAPARARRLGRMNITSNIVDSDELAWDIMAQLAFMPWHVQYDPQREVVGMLGTSPMFDELPEGEAAPYYHVIIHNREQDDSKWIEVEVQREAVQDIAQADGQELSVDSKVVGGEQ